MDSMAQNEDVTRAIMALLVAQTAHDLSVWGQWQAELGADSAPKSDECFPATLADASSTPSVDRQNQNVAHAPSAPSAATAQPVTPRTREAQPHTGSAPNFLASFAALHSASAQSAPNDPVAAKNQLDERIQNCRQCPLGNHRRGVLCGYGPIDAQLLIVCAGGNPYEFQANRVMAGKSDNAEVTVLFDNIIKAMTAVNPKISAESIYFTNVIKCCAIPPRQHLKSITAVCSRHLRDEVRIINPRAILVFGQTAYDAMFADGRTIIQARGQRKHFEQIPAIATHHPMECLKNRELKKRVWEDVRLVLHLLKESC